MSEEPFVRPAAVAGSFYPSDPRRLAAALDTLLDEGAELQGNGGSPPKALIVPHAGYVWSGSVAAAAYRRLGPAREAISRVVLAGPSHFVAVDGVAVSRARAFATPLGEVPVDDAARARVLALPSVRVDEAAHSREHSLEVQLPFLQRLLGTFTVLPLAVGEVAPDVLADVLDCADGGEETLVLASTDLSHYLDEGTAAARDAGTARAICGGDLDAIGRHDACGAVVLRGLLAWSGRHGLRRELLDLRTSADAGGPPERVVGYGAFAFWSPIAPLEGLHR